MECFFEDFTPGNRYTTPSRTITEADIALFVGVSGLFEPMFISDEAGQASPYGRRIAPGPMTVAVAEGLAFLAGLFPQCLGQLQLDASFLAPVHAGDTLRVQAEVLDRRETSKPDRGVVRFRHTVVNQAGTEVARYDVSRLLRRR